jgi:tRNA A-37 threonylcarbamoyl transferase component Bud32
MKDWHLAPAAAHGETARHFADLDTVFALSGEVVAKSPMSQVLRVRIDGRDYYVKRYAGLGKRPLRRLLDRPRVETEWQNLQRFAAWGIPTAPLVAYGLERQGGRWSRFVRGALVTAGIPAAIDLKQMAVSGDPRLKSRQWWNGIAQQIAIATRRMHAHGFVHNDLKWRNLLVDAAGRVYFIDCPAGGFWWGPFLRYRIIKDLACLDKVAKYHLSRTQRLRFYLDYVGRPRLDAGDKWRVRKIVDFFAGRE